MCGVMTNPAPSAQPHHVVPSVFDAISAHALPSVPGAGWILVPCCPSGPDPLGGGEVRTSFRSLGPIHPGKEEQERSEMQRLLSLLPFQQDPLGGQTQFLLQEFPQGCLVVTLAAFVPTVLCEAAPSAPLRFGAVS